MKQNDDSTHERELRRRRVPSIDEILSWEADGGCEATDGCWVEPDGTCEHGKPSWMIVLGLI